MSRDKYLSCATCHFDGDSDGRVWDFTDRGEGLRNTIALTGRTGMRHGPVHWSANFDEIQDFENDIRSAFGGSGFMSDTDFNTGTRSLTLGDPKTGVSADLDAMAAYVASLKLMSSSPFRNSDGSMTADAIAGQKIFMSAGTGCAKCHHGPQLTDSDLHNNPFLLHNVGTLTTGSGKRLGVTLTGLDTPTLKGIWETAPYLHDGSAATLMDVITTKNTSDQHGQTSQLTVTEQQQLVAYLQQIDNIARSDYESDGDVDQCDFGYLQNCFSDAGPGPGCDWADLNGDGLVNDLDYSLFESCFSGPDTPADLNCAE
jgi:cytochrome c peroxidase